MKFSSTERHTALIKRVAADMGFLYCGISKAERLNDEAEKLETWLKQGMNGKMGYMANYFEKRLDPKLLVPGAKSVVSLLYNYYPKARLEKAQKYKIAKYAYGEDYHFVIKDKLKLFLSHLKEEVGEVDGRIFVDSAPVMERQWAAKGGLGWLGKNTLLLNRSHGSFFFLAELIIDLELEYDGPIGDYCGTCTKCLDACPTAAFPQPGVLDANRCISYLTIELKDEIPIGFEGKFDDWVFGCDICQDVCPWNRFSKPHHENAFEPSDKLKALRKEDWEEMTREVFDKVFKKSALKRTKWEGLKRNMEFTKKKPRYGG